MDKQSIKELVLKYNEGLADPAEIKVLEQLIEQGDVALTELRELQRFDDRILRADTPVPSLELDDRFYAMLADEKRRQQRRWFMLRLPAGRIFFPRLAVAAAVVGVAFTGGYWFNRPANSSEVRELSAQVGDLKEMVMLTLLEKESASDRLKAVSLTNEMDQASRKVTTALLQTLNHDDNVNVRLAALDALRPYTRDNHVRTELIRSIAHQDSPLVQVALAELMGELLEKKSVLEFQKLLKGNKIPQEVKRKINENIQVLI
jgi:hypothetical protein